MEMLVSLRELTGKVCFLEHFRSVQLLCRDVSCTLLVSATFWVSFLKLAMVPQVQSDLWVQGWRGTCITRRNVIQAQPYGLTANEPGPGQHPIQLTFPTALHQPDQGLLLVTLAGDICPGNLAFPGLGCYSIPAASALHPLNTRLLVFFF